MLNEEATEKAQNLLRNIIEAKEKGKLYDISIDELLWLANAVIWIDNTYKAHKDFCFNKCTYGEHDAQ